MSLIKFWKIFLQHIISIKISVAAEFYINYYNLKCKSYLIYDNVINVARHHEERCHETNLIKTTNGEIKKFHLNINFAYLKYSHLNTKVVNVWVNTN